MPHRLACADKRLWIPQFFTRRNWEVPLAEAPKISGLYDYGSKKIILLDCNERIVHLTSFIASVEQEDDAAALLPLSVVSEAKQTSTNRIW